MNGNMNNSKINNKNGHHKNKRTGNGTSTTRTILRIKRRCTEESVPYMLLEGLDGRNKRGHDHNNRHSHSHSHSNNNAAAAAVAGEDLVDSAPPPLPTTALWKRFEPQATEDSYRIVNAMLLSSDEDDEDGRQTKRRKLTVLETTTSDLPSVVSMPRKQPFRVLDPLTRLVDDSLQEVHIGNKRVSEHHRFVTTDSRLMYDTKKWLAWCHGEGGNLLHACALWNDVEMAGELLNHGCSAGGHECATLTEAVDSDGRTPYEVAQLSGHDSVCEILEAFGGDTSNFVYDIFCLDEDANRRPQNYYPNGGTTTTTTTGAAAGTAGGTTIDGDGNTTTGNHHYYNQMTDQPMAVELMSGVGYWTPEGELVLEAPEKSPASLDHVFDEDGEIDSNCEEYGGNDYPEEEDWGDDFIQGYSDKRQQTPTIDMYNSNNNREEADYNDLVHSGYD
jgi:hypothetical protein